MAGDTRARIVRAAMELFAAKGYNAASVAELLQRTQLNSGSLYHFFPSKQDILLAVLEAYETGIDDMLVAPLWDGVEDPIERVFALLGGYRAMLEATDCTAACPIGSLALELHEPDPAVREALAANFAAWTERVRRCLDEAGDRLPVDLDRRALAEFVLTVMEGAMMQARTHRDIGRFDRSVAQLRRHFDALQTDIEK